MGKKKKQKRYKGYREDLARGWVLTDDGKIYYSTIYDYILSLTNDEFNDEFDRRMKELGYFPPLEIILKKIVIKKFFPQYCGPFSSSYVGRQLKDLEFKMIPVLCDRLFAEAKRGADDPNRIIALYVTSAYRHIALCETVEKDGEIYLSVDPRLFPVYEKDDELYASHANTLRVLAQTVFSPDALLVDCNSAMVCAGFLQLMLQWRTLSHDKFHHLADWFLKTLRLEKSRKGAECTLQALNEMLDINDKELSDLILNLYEEHSSSFDQMAAKYPELDFISHGTCQRYETIEAFAKKRGETSEFFVEEAELGKNASSPGRTQRQINKAKREEYRQKVIKDMGTIFKEVQKYGTDFHVLNFTQNELKKKGTTSNYVAIAFKHGDHWYILVDSLRLGEGAIFLWKGEYSKGLEVLKQARSFARETPGITHKNHYHSIENIVKYRAIIQEAL